MKVLSTLVFCAVSFSAYSQSSDLVDEVNDAIDGECNLSLQAGAALRNMTNELVSNVNSRISAILDAYQMDCLSSLLNIDVPLFDLNINMDFCEIARDALLGGGGYFGGNGANASAAGDQFEENKSLILQRHQQRQDLLKQLSGKEG